MELDITHLIHDTDCGMLSGSVAELGANAGKITWANSVEEGRDRPLLRPDQIEEARDYFRDFGAWDDEERAAWSADEVQALVVEYIAGDIRELESLCMGDDGSVDWEEAERLSSEGTIQGSIYPGDDGRIYFTLSH